MIFLHFYFHLIKQVYFNNNKLEDVVFSSYLYRVNFNIPNKDLKVRLIYFRKVFRVLQQIFLKNHGDVKFDNIEKIHLHNSENGREIWLNFINSNKDIGEVSTSFSVQNIPIKLKLFDKIVVTLNILISIPFFYLVVKRKKDVKQNLIGLPNLIITLMKLKNLVNSCSIICYSGVYEPEANIYSYYLKKKGATVNFFVSGTPLFRFLTHIYCDTLYLGNAYQQEETLIFKNTILIQKILLLKPFSFLSLPHYNLMDNFENNRIAFYTSGIWKRREKGIYFDIKIEEKEKIILNYLVRYKKEINPEIEIILYLHPIEKSNALDYQLAKNHYFSWIGKEKIIEFAEMNSKTTDSFHLDNIAIVTISNTLFERLFSGFKTLIIRDDSFPNNASNLHLISFSEYNEFIELLEKINSLSRKNFFKFFRINKYLIEKY
jgi:hypothetical protein